MPSGDDQPTQPAPAKRGRLNIRRRRSVQMGPPTETPARDITLAETLDRVLTRGIVAQAEIVLSVAEIPLVYIGLQGLVSSVETAAQLANATLERRTGSSPTPVDD